MGSARSRFPFVALAAAALAAGVAACGGAHQGSQSSARSGGDATGATVAASSSTVSTPSVGAGADQDNDGDHGNDDVNWGNAASASDRRAVAALVKRYYELAAAGRAASACSLIFSQFSEEIPEIYGEQPDDPTLHGKTCPAVMAKVFGLGHTRLVGDLARLKVTRVRVKGLRALAMLNFGKLPERDIPVHRERRSWRIDALLDNAIG